MGVLTFAERLLWGMASIIVLLIIAFAILGYLENAGDGNVIGRFATWVNQRARPQAS